MDINWVAALLGSPAVLMIVGVILSGAGLWPLMFSERAPPESHCKTPAISLDAVTAPDEEIARQQAIEFYSIPLSQKFRVVAVEIGGGEEG